MRILEILFFQGSVEWAAAKALEGGVTLAPSAPGLADDLANGAYARALRSADLVIPDSGFMVLLWGLYQGEWLNRISGLSLMSTLLREHGETISREGFWVMPSEEDADALNRYLAGRSIDCDRTRTYSAPQYDPEDPRDPELLVRLEAQRPAVVIVAVAGGKQEALGIWLRDSLSYRPAIICIGAAIAFLTGRQACIPRWADRLYLGWLFRILSDPFRYTRRYLRAANLAWTLGQASRAV